MDNILGNTERWAESDSIVGSRQAASLCKTGHMMIVECNRLARARKRRCLKNGNKLKITFRRYPAIHTNYIPLHHFTII